MNIEQRVCMYYWQYVLTEVENYQKSSCKCVYTNLQDEGVFEETYRGIEMPEKKEHKQYYLSGEFSEVYLTQREAECMKYLVQGYTFKETGTALSLSARTIEFYVKNIKKKMKLRKKSELIGALKAIPTWQTVI